jgi:hypothetical protein
MYLSNRQMADEIRYVYDRKQLAPQLGNTLDRPTLLNKRQYKGSTDLDKESLKAGQNYAAHDDMMM